MNPNTGEIRTFNSVSEARAAGFTLELGGEEAFRLLCTAVKRDSVSEVKIPLIFRNQAMKIRKPAETKRQRGTPIGQLRGFKKRKH